MDRCKYCPEEHESVLRVRWADKAEWAFVFKFCGKHRSDAFADLNKVMNGKNYLWELFSRGNRKVE